MKRSQQPQAVLQQALTLYQQQQYQAALPLLQQLSQQLPEQALVWHVQALTLRKLGQLTAAAQSFTQALKIAPKHHEILNNYGNLLRQQQRYEQAQQQFRLALQAQPNFFEARYNLGLTALAQQQLDDALAAFLTVLKQQPQHTQARLAAAEAYRLQGRAQQALELLQQSFHAQSVAFLRQRALAFFALDEVDLAYADMRAALALQPRQLALHETFSNMRWLQQDSDWLGSYYEQLAAHNDWHDLRLGLTHRLIKAEQFELAEQTLQPLLQLDSVPASVWLLQGHLKRMQGQLARAEDYLQQALSLQPEHQEALYEMFVTQLGQQNYVECLQLSQKLVTLAPGHQGWWAMRATALKASGDWQGYQRLYDFARFVRPFALTTAADGGLSDFNQGLLAKLERLHTQKQHPLQQSLRSGTQTDGQLFLNQDEDIQALKQQISAALTQYIAELPDDPEHPFLKRKSGRFKYTGAWSVRLNCSGFHRNHYHSEGWISGCFYVSIPKAVNHDGHGWIKFGQAQLDPTYMDEPDYIVKPQAGVVVLFPSMMWHGTVPFADDEYRVTVAFDLVPEE